MDVLIGGDYLCGRIVAYSATPRSPVTVWFVKQGKNRARAYLIAKVFDNRVLRAVYPNGSRNYGPSATA